MTVSELLDLLEGCDPGAEVCIMSQEGWPFENAVRGAAVREDFAGQVWALARRKVAEGAVVVQQWFGGGHFRAQHFSDEYYMVAAVKTGISAAFNLSEGSINQRHAAGLARGCLHCPKLVGATRSEKRCGRVLTPCEDANREIRRRSECLEALGPSVQANENERRVERKRTEGAGGESRRNARRIQSGDDGNSACEAGHRSEEIGGAECSVGRRGSSC